MEQLRRLAAGWKAEANVLTKYGDERAATIVARMADDVLRALEQVGDELLNLREAAAVSGYSEDHLGRLVGSGKIKNAGRSGSPRIRRADLPTKPSATDKKVAPHRTTRESTEHLVRDIVASKLEPRHVRQ